MLYNVFMVHFYSCHEANLCLHNIIEFSFIALLLTFSLIYKIMLLKFL